MSFFETLGPLLNKTLDQVKSAKAEAMVSLASAKSSKEVDEDDLESFKESLAKICSASTYVMETSG